MKEALPSIDSTALFNALALPCLLVSPALTVLDANAAYLALAGVSRTALSGKAVFMLYGDAASAAQFEASLRRASATRTPDVITLQRFPAPGTLPSPAGWSVTSAPVAGSDGSLDCLLVMVGPTAAPAANSPIPPALPATDSSTESAIELVDSLRAANRLLHAERTWLRKLFRLAPGFIVYLRGPQLVFDMANAAWYRLVGKRDIIGMAVRKALPDIAGQQFISLLDEVYRTGKPFSSQNLRVVMHPEAGGEAVEHLVNVLYQPVLDDDGRVAGIFVQGEDVTAQQRALDDMMTIHNQWKFALDAAGDGVWDWNMATGEILYSQNWKTMLGYADDEIGRSVEEWRARVHPDDLPGAQAALDEMLMHPDRTFASHFRMQRKDGSWAWILSRGMVVRRDAQGRPLRMAGAHTDVSSTHQLSQQLQQSHTLLNNLSEQVPGMLYQFELLPDGSMRMPFCSEGIREMAELTPADVGIDAGRIWSRVHPDELPSLLASIEASAVGMTPWNHEFRMCLPVQGTCWRQGHAQPKKMAGGGVLWHGFVTDITERKRIEAELTRLALVAKKITTSVIITDANGHIEWVNDTFTRLTGYTLVDAAGKSPGSLLQGRDTNPDTVREMRAAIARHAGFDVTLLNYHKSGRSYWQHVKVDPVYDASGCLTHFIGVQNDVTEKVHADALIWRQANYDTLTELPNRRLFRDRLDSAVRKARRGGESIALLFIDLDRFKEANDLLGHDAGDILLKEAAQRVAQSVRDSDTVARLGGDEFTVILTAVSQPSTIDHIAQKILDRLAQPFQLANEQVYLSASIGITLFPDDASEPEELVRNADQAMYVAKNTGRNQFSYFTRAMQEQSHRRMRLSIDLRDALASRQLEVHFQPIVELGSNRVTKAEALLRWMHPKRGLIMPADFISLAEESGLIVEIGDWVFQQSAQWAQRWSRQLHTPFQISVNKSPVQFMSQRSEGNWLTTLSELGLPWNSISIEITEGLLLNASNHVASQLLQYQEAGIQVAIDDFGTGYSSLAYLKKFDIDYLKIDQSFVRDITTDNGARTIAETIIVMAHRLGLKVIAEGIETETQCAMLARAGCDYGQGFLFSKALTPERFESLLLSGQRAS